MYFGRDSTENYNKKHFITILCFIIRRSKNFPIVIVQRLKGAVAEDRLAVKGRNE